MPHSRRASGSRRPLRNRPENKARSRTPRHIPAAFAGQKDACKNKGPAAGIPAGRYRLSCAQPSGAPVRTSPCLPCARPMPMSTPPMRQMPEPCLLRAAHAAPPRTGGTGTGYAHGMRTPDLRASPPAGGDAPARAAQRPSVRRGGPMPDAPPGTPDAGMPLTRRPAAWTRVRRTQRSGCAPARTDPRTAGAAPGPLTPSRAAPRNRPRSDRSSSAGNPPSATACRTDSLGPACSRCL